MPAPVWTDPVDFVFEEQPASDKLNAQILANLRWLKPLYAEKPLDESLPSSALLQNDNHLVLPLDSNDKIELEMELFTVAGSTGAFKFQFDMPAGCTIHGVATYFVDPSLALTSAEFTNGVVTTGGFGSSIPVVVRGIVRVGSTAGDLQLKWAQKTSNATPTQVLTGSYLRGRRV